MLVDREICKHKQHIHKDRQIINSLFEVDRLQSDSLSTNSGRMPTACVARVTTTMRCAHNKQR